MLRRHVTGHEFTRAGPEFTRVIKALQAELSALPEAGAQSGSPAPGLPDCAGFAQSGMAVSAAVAVAGVKELPVLERSAIKNPMMTLPSKAPHFLN